VNEGKADSQLKTLKWSRGKEKGGPDKEAKAKKRLHDAFVIRTEALYLCAGAHDEKNRTPAPGGKPDGTDGMDLLSTSFLGAFEIVQVETDHRDNGKLSL